MHSGLQSSVAHVRYPNSRFAQHIVFCNYLDVTGPTRLLKTERGQ